MAYADSKVLEEDELESESELELEEGRHDSLRRWLWASAGLHAVPGAPHGSAVRGCAEATAYEHELASYLLD